MITGPLPGNLTNGVAVQLVLNPAAPGANIRQTLPGDMVNGVKAYLTNPEVLAGIGGGSNRTIATYAALEALTVAGASITDGVSYTVQEDPTRGPWVWSAGTGAGFVGDHKTSVKLTETSTGSAGRFYNMQGAPVVDTFAALRLARSGQHDRIQVRARATAGDLGGGVFNKRLGAPPTDNDGTILVPTGVTTYWWEREFIGPIDARWFGVVAYPTLAGATSGTDSSASLLAATRALSSITDNTARRVYLPAGFIRKDTTLEISRQVQLKGQGKTNTFIVCPGTTDGIVINHPDTSSDGGDGSGAILEDFQVYALSHVGNVNGISVHAQNVTMHRVQCTFWGKWGFEIAASLGTGNANDWRMLDCTAKFCGQGGSGNDRGGLYTHGNDSSAGKCFGLQCIEITGVGVREESFLGNYYEGCHVEVSSVGSYTTRSGQTSRSTFVSCYVEAAPAAKIYYPNCWLGGYPVSGFSSDSEGLILSDSVEVFPFIIPNREASGDAARLVLGDFTNTLGGGAKKAVFGFQANGAAGSGYTEDYGLFWDDTNKWWSLRRHANDSDIVEVITGWGNGRYHSQRNIRNLTVGANQVRVTSAAAAPTAGVWYKGDLVLDSTGTILGWRCTTAGGWGDARINTHAYTRYQAIAVSGFCYECVVDSGTSAGSAPTFNHASVGDTTTDGTVTWKYRGPSPPVFAAVTGGTGAAGADAAPHYQTYVVSGTKTAGYSGTDVTLVGAWNTLDLTSSGESAQLNLKNSGAAAGSIVCVRIEPDSTSQVIIGNDGGTALGTLSGGATAIATGYASFIKTASAWKVFDPGNAA